MKQYIYKLIKYACRYCLLLTACLLLPTAQAQEGEATLFGDHTLSLGVQVGSDIGGAVPYPLSNIPSPMNAYPRVNVSIGGKAHFPLYNNFSLGLECSYKRVAMDADARVENQRFNDNGLINYFSGTAEMNMSFTLLELPLYARYRFGRSNHQVLFGGYYAFVLSSKFVTIAQKGYTGTEPDMVASVVNPNDLDPMDFSASLGNWDAGALIGYELQAFSRFHIGLRFMVGFKDMFKSQNQYFEYKMLPMRGAITLSYNLVDFNLW